MTLDDKLCGHIIAVREDIPWAYMIAIRPIFDDIRLRLNTTDVRLPTKGEFLKWALAPQGVSELSGNTAVSKKHVCRHAVDLHHDPLRDEPLTEPKTRIPMVQSANLYKPESSRPMYPLRTECGRRNDADAVEASRQVILKNAKERESRISFLVDIPIVVWRRFERFILRNVYERRIRIRTVVFRRSMFRSCLIFNTRPTYPSDTLAIPLKPTLSNIVIYYLSMGLWVYRWPLSILYYTLFLPFICLIVLRHQTLLMVEEVLKS